MDQHPTDVPSEADARLLDQASVRVGGVPWHVKVLSMPDHTHHVRIYCGDELRMERVGSPPAGWPDASAPPEVAQAVQEVMDRMGWR